MQILLKLIGRFNAILIKIQVDFFVIKELLINSVSVYRVLTRHRTKHRRLQQPAGHEAPLLTHPSMVGETDLKSATTSMQDIDFRQCG